MRILLIKPSALGDIVHALPVLNLMRSKWPEAHISWLVNSGFSGILHDHPQLNAVIVFDRKRFGGAWRNPAALIGLLGFIRRLRREKYDLVVDLQGLLRTGIWTRLTRAKKRVGFRNARELAWLGYTHRVATPDTETHALTRYLAVADAIGCGSLPVQFVFPTDAADRAAVDAMLPSSMKKFALLFPGTNWATKRWPVEKFASIVTPLREQFGLPVVVTGGAYEASLADQIPGSLNLAGKTTLRQLVALIERAEVVVANDSGPMHIAAALGRPLVTIFGPTNAVRTGPWQRDSSVVRLDIACSPCYSRRCSHTSCMNWLEREQVLEVVREQLAPAGGSSAT